MKHISADAILFPDGKLVSDATLSVNEDGSIHDLVPSLLPGSKRHIGILIPGMINTHCHLELSHLVNTITPHGELHEFIGEIVAARKNAPAEKVLPALEKADLLMWQNGIQGVGDICNTNETFDTKMRSPIRYHSFIELFNFDPSSAQPAFADGLQRLQQALQLGLNASIVPHAPYSVPAALMKLIKEHAETGSKPWCIHNQETASENILFENGTGSLRDLFTSMGIDYSWMKASGSSSLRFTAAYFPFKTNRLLVHNTYTTKDDISYLTDRGYMNKTWFCLCPIANRYIENRLPDIEMLYHEGCRITIGTDSLASNHSLSILNELAEIHGNFPQLPLPTMLTWATANGADFMNWGDLGRFRPGNRPGILLLEGTEDGLITKNSHITRLY